MSHLPSRHHLMAIPPAASSRVSQPCSFLRRWLARAATRRVIAKLDERLLRDAGLTRAGAPASRSASLGWGGA